MRKTLLVCAMALAAWPAHAQDSSNLPGWSSGIDTVTVVAHPSPLMWHVTKGNSDVWLLGTVQPIPEDQKWDSARVETVLKGAKRLLLQPRASVGLLEGAWFMLTGTDAIYLPDGQTFEQQIPENLRVRFEKARISIGKDADHYEDYRVPIAGFVLEGDVLKAQGFSRDEPQDRLKSIAQRDGVSVHPMAEYEALPLLREVPSMSKAANEACLEDALDDIAQLSTHARSAAEAWAIGDLEGIKANYSEVRLERCLQAVPSAATLWNRAVADSVNAIVAALDKPGTTLAVVNVGALLRKNGVLDRLKASGLTIADPGE
ncbi:MAG: TraB/GumN family protein [Proteobacteria bacterium]|nr:TraB/GumN family protein [Pseudomonadota bacterium]